MTSALICSIAEAPSAMATPRMPGGVVVEVRAMRAGRRPMRLEHPRVSTEQEAAIMRTIVEGDFTLGARIAGRIVVVSFRSRHRYCFASHEATGKSPSPITARARTAVYEIAASAPKRLS